MYRTPARMGLVLVATSFLIALAGLAVSSSSAAAQTNTIYVEVTGDDSGTGTQADPLATIQRAVYQATPGTTILVGPGVYNESVVINTIGTATAPLVLKSRIPGEAIVDGTGVDGVTGFRMLNAGWWTVDGFVVRNFTSTGVWELAGGFYVAGNGNDITISNNHIHDIATTHPTSPIANGIGIYGLSTAAITNTTITGNLLEDLTLGWSEALVLNGNVDGFLIEDNIIRNVDNIGIDIIGSESWIEDGGVPAALNQARNGSIIGNNISYVDSSTNPVYQGDRSAGGIYVDGGYGVEIRENIIHHANIGIELASEAPGGVTEDIIVADNILYKNMLTGIALGGYESFRGTTQNVTIVNNTFYDNATFTSLAAGEIWFQFNVTDNIIQNNIVHGGSGEVLLSDLNTQVGDNTVDNNILFSDSGVAFFQIGILPLARPTIDPQLIDPDNGDFRIAATSPAASGSVAVTGVRTPDPERGARVAGTVVPPTTDDEIHPTVTCLAGNGRIDVNIINRDAAAHSYRVEIGTLGPRIRTIAPDDWWRSPVTGRPDGPIPVTVIRDGVTVLDTTLDVACDSSPAVSSPEIQLLNVCRGGNGFVAWQFANPTNASRVYIVSFEGVANRSTTAAPYGASVRGVSGRPDGTYTFSIRANGTVTDSGTVTVACD